jgi:hypothetical protein
MDPGISGFREADDFGREASGRLLCYNGRDGNNDHRKLKLTTTPDQFKPLRATQLAYRESLNVVSQYTFAHGKISNSKKLHQGLYEALRAQFELPAQMVCSLFWQVGATYKGLGN